MDPTARFFARLKKLAVTLETQTVKLQRQYENRNNDDDDSSETAAKETRAYFELSGDFGNLKGQIQSEVAQQRAQEKDVSHFIGAMEVMQARLAQDLQRLKGHWGNYGYKAPKGTQRATSQESEAEEGDEGSERAEEGSQEEAGGSHSSSPMAVPAPSTDVLHTPQLSDFGLSEMQLKRNLAGVAWCSEVPPMPEMRLPHPALNTPALPPMPLTPKCALRMDDDELQTPQMSDFGISEPTLCLNNDFTMDRFRMNVEKPQRPPEHMPAPPVNALMESLHAKAAAQSLESPEPPEFCTPGLKIKKTNGRCSPSAGDLESPDRPGNLPTTPEVPAFQTPYMNRLVSTKKSARQSEPVNMQDNEDTDAFKLSTPPNGASGSKRPLEYNVPDISITGMEDKQMPEMPNLESDLGNSLQTRRAKMLKTTEQEKVMKEPTVSTLELDGPTQEFSLGTPRIRMDYEEPGTPEMPDLSSVTQDICKLVSQAQSKRTATAIVHPSIRPENNKNRAASLCLVSEREFQSLPIYMRQMTLASLNLVVQNINKFTSESQEDQTEFGMDDLRRICSVGAKTPVYILCLTELQRLKHTGGARNTSVYKLCSHN